MKVIMAGINYKISSINQREKLALDNDSIRHICTQICGVKGIYGCVIVSTCNRTEVYISCDVNMENCGAELLVKYSGADISPNAFEKREGMPAVYYLTELACGLKSMILGEGQIASQLNDALKIAHDAGCTDSVLNTLFRIAVSAGKYALTNAKISNVPLSCAYGAVSVLEENFGSLTGKSCLVIGNGKMGRLVQQLLLEKGCKVFVTLREYKHGNNDVLPGCGKLWYSQRYEYMEDCDFVISATKSPHFTVARAAIEALKNPPKAVIDLAVPRDVEAGVEELCFCRNIDTLGYQSGIDEKSLSAVNEIVQKFANDFVQWHNYKMSLPHISKIKEVIAGRIIKGGAAEGVDFHSSDRVYMVVSKTVDMLLGSMKDSVEPDNMGQSRKRIEERAVL